MSLPIESRLLAQNFLLMGLPIERESERETKGDDLVVSRNEFLIFLFLFN
jgi:hypothetical protein